MVDTGIGDAGTGDDGGDVRPEGAERLVFTAGGDAGSAGIAGSRVGIEFDMAAVILESFD